MIKAGIAGASGYTGAELLRLMASHPEARVHVASRQEGGEALEELFPSMAGYFGLELISHDPAKMGSACDVVFCCMPHKASMGIIPELLDGGAKVVDLSADFRFDNIKTYEKWYTAHSAPDLNKEAVYGMPELYREKIKPARLVGNPGCYPTGAILALTPLVRGKLADIGSLIIDSKSGVSGAGAKPGETTHYVEVNESIRAYGVGSHRHTPEIEEQISALAGEDIKVSFTPHLTPMERGILTTCYATLDKKMETPELLNVYGDFYKNEKFVRILPEGVLPRTKWVRGSNYTDIGAVSDPRTGRAVIVSAIDNLVKGAAGGAIQNMNIMTGLPEEAGLEAAPLYP